MENQDIDVFEALAKGEVFAIKNIDERLFKIEQTLKATLDGGVINSEFETVNSLYKSALASRELLKELY